MSPGDLATQLPSITADEHRVLMGSFPTGVSIVTAADGIGAPHGMTCTSLSSVTLQPPTLLVCLHSASGTMAAVRDSGSFAVNLLHAGAQSTAELFSSPTPDRFGPIAWRPSDVVAAPWLIVDAFALAECRVDRMLDAGDHQVVFGTIVSLRHSAETPLLYGLRRYSLWTAGTPPKGR